MLDLVVKFLMHVIIMQKRQTMMLKFYRFIFSFTMFRGKFEQVIDFSRLHLISIEFESGIYSHL